MDKKIELSSNDVINMFMEAGLDDDEIKKAINTLEDFTPEAVYNYLNMLKEKEEKTQKEKEEQKLENERKNKEMLKKQAEWKKNQLRRVKTKISAAQDENRKREEEFDNETQKGYDDVVISEYFRIRIFNPEDKQSMWIGLKENATIKDLFNKVRDNYSKKFTLSNYASGKELKENDKNLSEVFPSRTCMLELNGTLLSLDISE
ncbi:hypothetical protein EHP00_1254 [Ecytonucleospora hepatopenaei]|uniref:Uncharacterized protein n=1 Tax=Ecytonucleospora hepatopenaei TaxID=646526 RepID=A0A1W0E3F3_9MICR|nr:hypothetical protein EHP00_1254 [Ecytonucleospora hepatopenaei]